MGMGMGMPMMGQSNNPAPPGTNGSQKTSKTKLIPQEIPKSEKKDEKPPVTTVFVGNISDRAPDAMVRQMLQRCGNVLSWKRVQGASGKLQAFGFCEYESPEATLRCIRLLNEWGIADKRLVVKVDAKTKSLLDDYKRQKKEEQAKEENGDKKDEDTDGEVDDDKSDTEENLDDFTMREDRVAKAGLDAIMREYSADLSKAPPRDEKEEKREKKKSSSSKMTEKDDGLDDMELEEDTKNLINREIRSFRDAHKVIIIFYIEFAINNYRTLRAVFIHTRCLFTRRNSYQTRIFQNQFIESLTHFLFLTVTHACCLSKAVTKILNFNPQENSFCP